MRPAGYVAVGRVKRAHGIRGEVVVLPLTDSPGDLFAPGARLFVSGTGEIPGGDPGETRVRSHRSFGRDILVHLDGIDDRTAAELWRGRYLYVRDDEVAAPGEGEAFVHELFDMRVVSASGQEYGHVSEVYDVPQGLLLEVRRPDGSTAMLPYRAEMITNVDRARRMMTVEVPEGLFDG